MTNYNEKLEKIWKGNMKKKANFKKLGIQVAVLAAIVVLLFVGVKAYNYVYTQGYEAGTRNTLVCAASERDATLKPLCR